MFAARTNRTTEPRNRHRIRIPPVSHPIHLFLAHADHEAAYFSVSVNFVPSASMIPLRNPTGVPFLAGRRVIVTSSFGFREFLVQPALVNLAGLLVSQLQCT